MTATANRSSASPEALRAAIPNSVALASGKGGVGKTWLASTLAGALAYQGDRVLLFDGDLGLANIDVQLGLSPEKDLSMVLSGRAPLEEAVATYGEGTGSFDVLAGASGSGALSDLSAPEIAGLLQGLKALGGHYDRLLIDLGAGVDPHVTQLAAAAQTLLVVVTDEPTSMTDAYAFIKILVGRHGRRDIRIAVNMAETSAEGRRVHGALATACQNFLGFEPPLAGIVRRDARVKQAIRQQTPLLARYPQSDAGLDASRMASTLAAAPKT
ncbi:MAG: MinD/ParA family protein [Pseudomonadota bacterium]